MKATFPFPWRVAVNPFGPSAAGDEDNVFIVDAEGSAIFIVAKHPVWTYKKPHRVPVAQEVVRVMNLQLVEPKEEDGAHAQA